MAGENSMRKISVPFQVATKRSMMLRGMMRVSRMIVFVLFATHDLTSCSFGCGLSG